MGKLWLPQTHPGVAAAKVTLGGIFSIATRAKLGLASALGSTQNSY